MTRQIVAEASFGEYLRNERLARQLRLEEIGARSKIATALLEGLERNDLSRFPRDRFYKEHLIRAYAAALGLDPQRVIERFRRDFPVAASPAVEASRPAARWGPVSAVAGVVLAVALIALATRDVDAPAGPGGTRDSAGQESSEDAEPRVAPLVLQPLAPPAPSREETAFADVDEKEGELTVTSTPPGARVIVNGLYRGDTPVRVQFLPMGSYTVRVIEDGYRSVERRVTITPTRLRLRVAATLPPESPANQ